jgi:hypothetical protein
MQLVGCTSPPLATFRNNATSIDLDNKFSDCGIRVSIQYPAIKKTFGWFETSRWMVSITSTRPLHDKMRFEPIDMILGQHTLYDRIGEEDRAQSDKLAQSMLHLVAILGSLYCILKQSAGDAKTSKIGDRAFCSLTMIFCQWLGMLLPLAMYLLSLVTDHVPSSSLTPAAPGEEDSLSVKLLEALVNIARSLCCLALMILFGSVKRARDKQRQISKAMESAAAMEMCRSIYVAMFVACMAMGALDTMESKAMAMSKSFWFLYMSRAKRWKQDLADFGGYLLDLFLLPQVAQNSMAGNGRSGALIPTFYIGITVLQCGLHLHHIFLWRWRAASSEGSALLLLPPPPPPLLHVLLPCLSGLLASILHLQQAKAMAMEDAAASSDLGSPGRDRR